MHLFTSKREKRLWLSTLVIIIAIYSTLSLAQPASNFLSDHGLLTPFFILGMLLVAVTILTQGFQRRIKKIDIGLTLGVIVVYLMVFVRMEIPEERTHLIEYGVLAIFVHEAIKERYRLTTLVLQPALIAIFITAVFGIIDECIQIFLPNRVFDFRDIIFNTLAGIMAIGISSVISWVRDRVKGKP
ncbi:MAG: VanZ family protein [Bacteroidetes bacterium]|nr:MAG: VanZ family protein [Bacteroidota bacterium]